jgi:hypothetical protein
MKTNTSKIENWEEDFDKQFKVSYNYEHIKTKLFTPEERLLWSIFGRDEKKPQSAVKDFITQEIAKAKEDRDREIIEMINNIKTIKKLDRENVFKYTIDMIINLINNK